MSLYSAVPTHKCEEEAVAGPISPQPTRRRIDPAAGVAPGRPVSAAAPPDRHPPQHDRQDLDLFEFARMDREMAREMGQNSQRRNKKSAIGTALANMSTPRLLVLITGVLLLVGGLVALRFPVFLADFDRWGFQINCGSGFQIDVTQAGIADTAGTHFVQQCHAAIAMRRAWTVPVMMAGALLLSAQLFRPSRRATVNRENTETARKIPSVRLSWSPSSLMLPEPS